MKLVFTLLFAVNYLFSFGQEQINYEDYREKDPNKQAYGYISDGEVSKPTVFQFMNLDEDKTERNWTNEKNRTISTADLSMINIRMDNIARVVLYATNIGDISTVNSASVEIRVFRDNKLFQNTRFEGPFSPLNYTDIYLNFERAGLDSISILFHSKDFLVGKLKVIPLNAKGVEFYKDKELREMQIKDLSLNLDSAVKRIQPTYIDELKNIDMHYSSLTSIIDGNMFGSLATQKANSLNPISNEEFVRQYEAMVSKYAVGAKKNEFEEIKTELSSLKISSIVNTVDQLVTGGRFSNLINFMSGVFDNGIRLEGEDAPLVAINDLFYKQDVRPNGTIKLSPVAPEVKSKISALQKKNNNYITLITKLTEYYYEDINHRNQLSLLINDAKKVKVDYEKLVSRMFKGYVADTTELFRKGSMNVVDIITQFNQQFVLENMTELDKSNLRLKSDKMIDELHELKLEYDVLMSKIKSQYDKIYLNTPNIREDGLKEIKEALPQFYTDFNESQRKIVAEYTKPGGVQSKLREASGR